MIHRSSKRVFSLFILLLAGVLSMSAQQVTKETALSKATQFFQQSDAISRRAARKAPQFALANNRNEFYVFNDEANGGYVVVSGDERMPDVLGYSYTGHFDAENIPCNMKAWLEDYAAQVAYLRTHPEVPASRRKVPERNEISPLLKCQFSQGKYYNEKCPIVDGEHCVTGCVATAMAQIMYYYQWPRQTTDVIPAYTSYSNKIDMPAIPVTTIDWDYMLNKYNSWEDYSDEQIDAISTLMLLCGTSVKMDYDLGGSGAGSPSAVEAFLKYFDYDDILEYLIRGKGELEVWEQMIYDDLSDGHPVYYDGGSETAGHAFVLDGYKDGYFHVNWGWGGYQDDYFLLTDLNGYNYGQGAIFGIRPDNVDNPSRYAVFDNGKMTLYYDKESSHRSGTILPHMDEWSNYKDQITKCIIDPSYANLRPKSLNSFFYEWSQLKSIEGLENLNTSNVTDMGLMFYGCSALTTLDVSGFKTDNVTNMSLMFFGCSSLTNLDVSGFKTDNVTDMGWMFYGCSNLTNLDVSGFKTDNVTTMSCMFYNCSSLTSLDVSGFKTSDVMYMGWMFGNCSCLTSLDVSGFKTDNVTNMGYMFAGCSSLTSLNVSGFKTDNVTNMNYMFDGCSGLTSLDVSGFKMDNVTDMSGMFYGCYSLTSITMPNSVTSIGKKAFYTCFELPSVTIGSGVESIGSQAFARCSKLADVYCYAVNVPNTNTDAFNYSPIESATLHVPTASVDAYKAAEPWKNFKEIVPLGETGETGGTETIKMAVASGDRTAIGYSSANGLDFTNVTDVKAWIVSGFTANATVLLSRVKIVPPNTGLYLTSDVAGVEVVVPKTNLDVYYANLLLAAVNEETIDPTEVHDGMEYTNFVVGKLNSGEMGFVRVKNTRTLGPNKSRLLVPSSYYPVSNQAPELQVTFTEDGSTTNLQGIDVTQQSDSHFFDLQGRKLSVGQAQKGVYIYNGKKYVIK